MRKLILLFFLVTFVIGLSAQNKLTNREVFAFDSGDVIHWHTRLNSGPDYYTKRTFITGANIHPGVDTIHFVVVDTNLNYSVNATNHYEMVVTKKLVYCSQLDSTAPSYDHFYKYLFVDTFNLNICNDTFYSVYRCDYLPKQDTPTLSEVDCETIYFSRGLGAFNIHESYGGGSPRIEYLTIDYYKKSNRECGKRLTVGVKEPNQDLTSIFIYPNPVHSTLYMSGISQGKYLIYSYCGQLIAKGTIVPSIQLDNLEPGFYFIAFENENLKKTLTFIKE